MDLKVCIDGKNLMLSNPLMGASGTVAYGEEMDMLTDISCFGAIVTKSISFEARIGNPPPRIVETPSGMLNSIGLQNVGVNAFIRDKLPFLRDRQIPAIVSIFGCDKAEYVAVARTLQGVPGILALELNASCPNVKAGGMEFGTDPKSLR